MALFSMHLVENVLAPRWGAGGTPLHGLKGEVRPDRVWFPEGLICLERGIAFISLCLKQGVATRSYVFVNLQKPQPKPNFTSFPVHSVLK